MNKTAIKNFAVWARQKLISDITYKAGMLGITEDGIADKLPHSTSDLEFYDIGTKDYAEVSGKEIKQRNALVNAIRKKEKDNGDYKSAFGYVVEEVAYTWFNRLIAIRFMEVNDYLPSGVRVLSSENKAKKEPDLVTTPFDTDLEFTSDEQDKIIQLKDDNKLDELFRMLFIKQCNKLHDVLPELFENTDDYTELLLTVSFTDSDGVLYHLVHDIEDDDFNVEKEGQVQIIGWLYQFYNIEPKAVVFGRKGNAKIKKEEIPAATQLFTPDWIVRYMVQNSLGRIFINDKCTGITDEKERINKEKEIAQQMGWQYYLPEAEQTPEVRAQLNANHISLSSELTSIKLIDPCMGSGHILVYAFEVLMQIYLECGYTERDATSLILENNLFGLDIDDRAYQLAYFAVMMKARSYDRRILTRNIKPNVYSIKESNFLTDSWQKISDDEKFREIFQTVVDTFIDAKEYGSILNIPDADYDYALSVIDDFEQSVPVDFEAQILRGKTDDIRALVNQAKLLSQKYDVVVTNPPYMPVSNSSASLQNFVKKNYPDSKTDMFAVFIERVAQLTKPNRYSAMITMHSWMFLSSYEKLRSKILETDTVNMAHLGARAFDEIGGEVVQTTAWIERKTDLKQFKATYKRLVDENSQTAKEQAFLNKNDNAYNITKTNFSKIPGSPIAYWVSGNLLASFTNGNRLGNIADSKQGIATADNNKYLRLWYEVSVENVKFDAKTHEEASLCSEKWYPYNKGGEFRKWYGNNDFVVNWYRDGKDLRNDRKAVLRNRPFYFKPCFSWSLVTSSVAAFRYKPMGHIFDVAGMSCFSQTNLLYLLALCNTKVVMKILEIIAPTINYQCGDIANIPVIVTAKESKQNIEKRVESCINISRKDWDSFETSWDFKRNPLV
ncbi:BREX-1 system adenine-specific DNA-methyltransferase PglX [Ruminococcus bromii]|uniref:BREX-1 system adenine-specific DNA-methyltransferase PglX n=1 Tax=Ruminococcus bromii TaxID=40518 RepID=UPI003FD748EA